MSDIIDPERLAADAKTIMADLVALDTTSRLSNLKLIEQVEARLTDLGVASTRVASADGGKANLYATLGPAVAGGIVLSGHTDVVPVDGQKWTSDPFTATRRGDRIYGRGTCDMKGFLALALAAAPAFAEAGRLQRPVHLAFSYDEEVGCLGAPDMIAEIAKRLPRPAAVVVGEPTGMALVGAHKSVVTHRVTVTGHEAHSSLTHLGLSANMVAVQLMACLADIAEQQRHEGDAHSPFCPAHTTLTIGEIAGGTALNILARECRFGFDLRCQPGVDPDPILAPFHELVARCDAEMKRRFPETGIAVEREGKVPAMAFADDSEAEQLVRALTGANGPAGAAAYVTEAGQYQQAGFPTVVCGPGSIDQAHQPDEYIEIAQLAAGARFMSQLAETLAR